jgi:uncharacterized membrane protein
VKTMEIEVEDNRTAVNIGDAERLVSGVLGGWMIVRGLAKPSLKGLVLMGSGIALVCRAATGRSRLYRRLHISGAVRGRRESASIPYQTGVKVEEAVTVAKPAEELYQFWKNPENLSRFMTHVESVTWAGHNRSHWIARGPIGTTIEWDAEIINDQPNRLIGWRSSPEAQVRNAGSVSFRPFEDGQRTEVKLSMEYQPAGGPLGAGIAAILGEDPAGRVREDLQRFKQLMESGNPAGLASAATSAG